ncbi:ankyrin repeat domain-containing protein 26-like [Spea bombifrons]|uniref:ankyrin repeat domain-containing protein 26-like n=1 Tax=Spea bombifrons TaxID=233779 RepID=UPI00234B2C4F|nr:ankyrin repeat domain-containing protein 26-like [Spea bombifrons]
MKKLFSFGKKKKRGMSPSPSETGSVLSGYDVEVKELGKLHRAASSGDVDKIRQLIRKHDINEPDKDSRTPLHLACALGHPDAVATLIENKPKLNICDNDHRSPLMKAIQCQQERCATILLEHGADPNVADINGNAALHFAALIPSMPLAVQLLDHGADINASNKEGCTPLMLAVTENHEEIVEFLLNQGADVNTVNKSHRTSLLIAASKGYINLVKMLLQNNADPFLKDEKGWTPDDHAVVNGHHACSHLIIEHCARKPIVTPHVGPSKFSATKSMVGIAAKTMEVTKDISEAGDISESSASQKSGGVNSWPSSDDELDFSPKKNLRPNLKEMLDKKINAIQKPSVTAAQPISFSPPNKSDSNEDSFHGSDNEDPPQPNPFPQTFSFNQRVPCTPSSYPKPFYLASSHLSLNKADQSANKIGGNIGSDLEDSDEESCTKGDICDPVFESKLQDHGTSDLSRKTAPVEIYKPIALTSKDVSTSRSAKQNESNLKLDMMADLGLDDADGIEDLSDWDSTSDSLDQSNVDPSPRKPLPKPILATVEKPAAPNQVAACPEPAKKETESMRPTARGKVLDAPNKHLQEFKDTSDLSDWDSTSDSVDQRNVGLSPRKLLPKPILAALEKPAAPNQVVACPEPAKKETESIPPTARGKVLDATNKHLQEFKDTSDVMADLGLDDPAGIEDLSDWDSSSFSLEQSNLIPKTGKLPSEPLTAPPKKPAIPTPVTAYPEPKEEEPETTQPAIPDKVLESTNKHLQPAKNSGDLSDWDSTSDSLDQSNLNPKPGKLLPQSIPATLEKPAVASPDPVEKESDMQGKGLESTNKHLQQVKNMGDSSNLTATAEHKPVVDDMLNASNLTMGPEFRSDVNYQLVSQQPSECQAIQSSGNNQESSSSDSEEPWEERYEKMWVDNEKREVKIHFKDVTAELKEKFGESKENKKKSLVSKTSKNTMHSPKEDNPHRVSFTENQTGHENEMNVLAFKEEQTLLDLKKPDSETAGQERDNDPNTEVNVNTHGNKGADKTANPTCSQSNDCGEIQLQQTQFDNSGLSQLSYGEVTKKLLDQQLEKDMQRFKNEVGMLQTVFLNLAQGREQLQNKSHTEVEKGDSLSKEVDVSHGSTKKFAQRTAVSDVQEGQKQIPRHKPSTGKNSIMTEGTKNVILNSKLYSGHNSHDIPCENGKLPEMYDDSTFSDASQEDEGGEAGIHTNWRDKMWNPDESDDLSHSSDTGTDENELLCSTFRNAALLIDQLNAAGLDSVNLLKIQNLIQEYERSVQKEKGRHVFLSKKVKNLENERKDLQQIKDTKRELESMLEHQKVDFESDLSSLRFSLKQEEEKRKNAEMLHEKVGDQLRKKEDQCCKEMQEKQQLELTLRNMELELRSLRNNMKQVEEERNEAQRLLSQERNARVIDEETLNNLRRRNEEQEAKILQAKTAEVLAQPSDAGEKNLIQKNLKLQEEIALVKEELLKLQSNTNEEESQYIEENEMLKEKIDDLRRDLKNNEETLTQSVYQYNRQLNVLKTEASMLCTKLEHEKQSKERLENEVESIRSRLTTALQELERLQLLKTDIERTLQRERDEWMRFKDKLNHDLSNLRETNNNTSQQLSRTEAKCNGLENELHRVGLSLQEKCLLLESTQRELVQAQDRTEKLERTLQLEKEQTNKNIIKQESVQERLAQLQSENIQLRQQLEDVQNKGITKDKTVSEIQDRFTDIFNKVRADNERQVHLVEERNKDLINKSNELREQIYKLETEKVERESSLRNLQNELADALKKLAMSEASLEVITRYRNDLEDKKQHLQKELENCKMKLQDMEEQFLQSERHNHHLKNLLDDKEREICAAVQKSQEFSLVAAEADKSVKQLEQHVQRLEIENAKFETAAKQQTSQTEILQKELKESLSSWNRMEELLTHVQSSKIDLEEKLSQQVHMKPAHDSHNLWEEELKSISRLSIRLAGVEREKSELAEQVECERKKVKKLVELKKSFETRFDQEVKRNNELQGEMARLKTLLKATKKKLKGLEAEKQAKYEEGAKHPNLDAADSEVRRLKHKVEELGRETAKSAQLEHTNRDLQEQLSSMKILQKKYDQLEKGKRYLEENIADLKRLVESNKMDHGLLEKYKKEIQERGRQELQQKLDEVNLFLQAQAASQESLEQMQAAKDASIRGQLENRIHDLESELHKIKMSLQESTSQKDSFLSEVNRFKDLYAEEMKMRKSLATKLERANEKLEEAKAKLLNEREKSKSFITSSIVNGSLAGTPVIDTSQLGLRYGNLSVNETFSLGGSILNPVGNGLPTNRVDTYLSKVSKRIT